MYSTSILVLAIVFIPLFLTFFLYSYYRKAEKLALVVGLSLSWLVIANSGFAWPFIILIATSLSFALHPVLESMRSIEKMYRKGGIGVQ